MRASSLTDAQLLLWIVHGIDAEVVTREDIRVIFHGGIHAAIAEGTKER